MGKVESWLGSNAFNRPYAFAEIAFRHQPDQWLLGGFWAIRERHPDHHVVELTEQGAGFVGWLMPHSTYRERGNRVNLENRPTAFTVSEILAEPYASKKLPGHDGVEVGFAEPEALIRSDGSD